MKLHLKIVNLLINKWTSLDVREARVCAGDYFLMNLHLKIVHLLINKLTISDVREAPNLTYPMIIHVQTVQTVQTVQCTNCTNCTNSNDART